MTSLVDIAKRRKSVPIQGELIPVQGIGAEGLVYLIERFPEFREMIFPSAAPVVTPEYVAEVVKQRKQSSRAVRAPVELSDPPSLMNTFPKALPAILAAGTGHLGDAEHERAARELGADDQLALLDGIMELTMPNGITAFLERLTVLFGAVSRQPSPNENEPTSSPSVPNGKASDTQSPSA